MPEVYFSVVWPDGSRDVCYSPSTAVRAHFTEGTAYPLPAFLERSRSALHAASERVRERYGRPCGLAMGQLARIEARAAAFDPGGQVVLEAFMDREG